MGWPSVVILGAVGERAGLEARIRGSGVVPDAAVEGERLYWRGYSYHLDLSGGILADYEPDEVEEVAARVGEPYGVWVASQSMEAARVFLREVLSGFDGLLDTNHGEILAAGEFLALIDRYPDWDWRRRESTELP